MSTTSRSEPRQQTTPRPDDGFAMVSLVIFLVPLLLLVGSFLQTMTGRQSRLQLEINEEQAMLASEAGLDIAMNEARRGTLVAGLGAVYNFSGTLDNNNSYEVTCTYLGGNGISDDGDGDIDMPADPDEDCFRVTTTGTAGNSQRRVAAYLGFTSYLPTLNGAVTITNPDISIDIGGSGYTTGDNHTLSGALVGSGNTYGLSIAPPGDVDDLLDELSWSERSAIDGIGGSPSLGTTGTLDIAELVDYARNGASVVITNKNTNGYSFGSQSNPVVAYRLGELRATGNTTGYGILVVEGDLTTVGTMTWNGVVVVTGALNCGAGTAEVNGAVLLGPECPSLRLRGTIDLRYSSTGVDLAAGLLGRYVAFNGWQEIATGN
jgi:hypothetical protein